MFFNRDSMNPSEMYFFFIRKGFFPNGIILEYQWILGSPKLECSFHSSLIFFNASGFSSIPCRDTGRETAAGKGNCCPTDFSLSSLMSPDGIHGIDGATVFSFLTLVDGAATSTSSVTQTNAS